MAEDAASVREQVRTWLAANWRPGIPRSEWLEQVVDAGWAVPTWPTEWHGRDLPGELANVVGEEFRAVGAPGARQDQHNLWANTVLAYGTDELKKLFVRPLLLQEVEMCLLYSEPGAGSDLAGLQTRADLDGDEYVVNGQKVWTSNAKRADYGMLIARTDWDVPKHRGISFFWLPMRQDGVEVRPIRQITDEAHFNEVFLTDARVPATHMLGDAGQGWRVLQTALAYERSVMGDIARGPRTSRPAADGAKAGEGAPQPGPSAVDLAALARQVGRNDDPVIRQEIAYVHSLRAVNRWNAQRAKAQLQQGSSSPLVSLGKLAMSRILHVGAAVQGHIVGAEAMLDGDEHPDAADANFLALNAYFTSIGGGTDQIQRNIIGERVLGLPKEPELDRDVPFRDVRKATVDRP
ncbi:MAG: acyl-CoA dehydrogenase family protein [Actinomycetota bacterium]|nr:acyl-CoA dehydrogenase family protein [Actinomycetota bacterium]